MLRWGILGTGNIANQFAKGMPTAKLSQVTAVGSRSVDSAQAFATTYEIANAHGSYEALINDDTVDAVYLSLPNTMHCEWTIAALKAGKHVLCEKPLAVTGAEAERMYDTAAKEGKRLMEAFMYRCHPLMHAVANAITTGKIGRVTGIRSSFCYRTNKIDGNVRFQPNLCGGALMDVGCYCINFSRYIAGAAAARAHTNPAGIVSIDPDQYFSVGRLHETQVDDVVAGCMSFPGAAGMSQGISATFQAGMSLHADNTAYVLGDEGYIAIPIPWKPPIKDAVWVLARSTPPKQDIANAAAAGKPLQDGPLREEFRVDAPSELYAMEADAFADAVLHGKPLPVSADDTLGNTRVLEAMRRQIGLGY